MEDVCPDTGAQFLALISDGVSRAIREEKIYKSIIAESVKNHPRENQQSNTWASKAVTGNADVDGWQFPSGIAVLALTPAKAAIILRYKEAIAARFGNAKVERQEAWTTFVVGPLPKKISTLDGVVDLIDGLIQAEPSIAAIKDSMLIHQIAWNRRSSESTSPTGFIRIHIPETKAYKFPSRLQLFEQAMNV
ncbi:hypothetical protein K3495_g10789 [Podosphaera aphanis]|nr:hypothetical protein K3495_g10789 [Podosphaera aphanis]